MSDTVFVSRRPAAALGGMVARVAGYAAGDVHSDFTETAELVFPLIFNLGTPWDVALGSGAPFLRNPSFASGLFAGPVRVTCESGAELVQVDLTPLGAVRLFGEAAGELGGLVADLGTVPPFTGHLASLQDRLHNVRDWHERFDIIEGFLAKRFLHEGAKEVRGAWHLLASGQSVSETARALGWSTRHLSTRFRRETGLRPVTAARILRFGRARALARAEGPNWAAIAAETGYADQAHMIRDFREFAGQTPGSWANQALLPAPRGLT